jgi:hypothetical protein
MTNQYFLDRIAGRNPNLRAADADRERTADGLRKSHAEGRLDLTEFQERLERCYEAKTIGELDELIADLPRQDERYERRPSVLAPRHLRLGPLVPLLIALIVLSAAIGHTLFWLWIPLVFIFLRISWWRHRGPWAGVRRRPDGWV